MEDIGSNEASQQSAYHADDDVTNTTIAAPFHDRSGQKTGDQTNYEPGNYSHNKILDILSIMLIGCDPVKVSYPSQDRFNKKGLSSSWGCCYS